MEQSLWAAVPAHLRRMSAALKKHTGRELPIGATPLRFGSWMGGDRDGNPNVTAKVRGGGGGGGEGAGRRGGGGGGVFGWLAGWLARVSCERGELCWGPY